MRQQKDNKRFERREFSKQSAARSAGLAVEWKKAANKPLDEPDSKVSKAASESERAV
jgi:hypothetical protein